MEQAIDRAIAPNMFLHNLRHICGFDAAIPHHVGEHPHRGAQVALTLTFAAQNHSLLPRHRGYKRRQQSFRPLGLTVPVLADPDLAGLSGTLTTCQTPYLGRRF
jgi:hypothetical protein